MEKESKVCNKCGSFDFVANGKYTRCSPCHKEQRKTRYQNRKEEFDSLNSKWAEANRDKSRAIKKKWRDTNKDKVAATGKLWSSNNKGKVREYGANRRANLKGATPSWADRVEMKHIHTLASEKGLVVDHIVPLTSKFVCGFNTPDNLRCISRELNAYKGNRYWPDMAKECA